jgi:hypothetical protein
MAQKVQVLLTDDVDGTEILSGKGETVTFGLDGKSYEIDLTSKNATALRRAIKPYVDAGRPLKGSSTRRRPVRSKVGADSRTIKEWARANGYTVKDRGRVPNEIRQAFEAANT